MNRNVLVVFLASPSDLAEERRAARKEVDEINHVIGRRLNWQLDLLGWEDTLPGSGRPQELINSDVDSCDLFLGLMYKRWGQPTGKYTSGFEEEFERAASRRRASTSPEIWLYFRNIPQDDLSDPGPQLRSVLSFRESVQESRELLFKEYPDADTWRRLFRNNLLVYVLDRCGYGSSETSPLAESSSGTTQVSRLDKIQELVPQQVQNIFDKYAETEVLFDTHKVERLDLFVTSLMSSIYSDRSIDTHSVNRVYRNRKTWELSEVETFNVLRSVISDRWSVNPGWYWVRNYSPDGVCHQVIELGINEQDDAVRARILNNIDRFGLSVSREQLEKMLNDEANLSGVLRLLKGVHRDFEVQVALRYVDSESPDVRTTARTKAVQLIKATDLERAFELGCEYVTGHRAIMEEFTSADIAQIPPNIVIGAIEKQPDAFRDYFLRTVVEAQTLAQDHYKRLLNIKSERVTKMSILGMIARAPSTPPTLLSSLWDTGRSITEELCVALLKSADELPDFNSINAYTTHGDLLYRLVAERNMARLGQTVRNHLQDRFQKFMDDSDTSQLERYGSSARAYLFGEDTREYVRSKFIAAALETISNDLGPEDLQHGLKHLNKTRFGLADPQCLEIIRRLGDDSIVPDLLALLPSSHRDSGIRLARTVLALSPTLESAAALARSSNTGVLVEATATLLHLSPDAVLALGKDLVNSDNQHQRMLGVLLLSIQTRECIEDTLQAYTEGGYYYNVVTALDAILYAPDTIAKWYLDPHNLISS